MDNTRSERLLELNRMRRDTHTSSLSCARQEHRSELAESAVAVVSKELDTLTNPPVHSSAVIHFARCCHLRVKLLVTREKTKWIKQSIRG